MPLLGLSKGYEAYTDKNTDTETDTRIRVFPKRVILQTRQRPVERTIHTYFRCIFEDTRGRILFRNDYSIYIAFILK